LLNGLLLLQTQGGVVVVGDVVVDASGVVVVDVFVNFSTTPATVVVAGVVDIVVVGVVVVGDVVVDVSITVTADVVAAGVVVLKVVVVAGVVDIVAGILVVAVIVFCQLRYSFFLSGFLRGGGGGRASCHHLWRLSRGAQHQRS
jgi:hypothetical protein